MAELSFLQVLTIFLGALAFAGVIRLIFWCFRKDRNERR